MSQTSVCVCLCVDNATRYKFFGSQMNDSPNHTLHYIELHILCSIKSNEKSLSETEQKLHFKAREMHKI